MFGMSGNMKQFGMGVILTGRNDAHGFFKNASSDFMTLRAEASKTDKAMIASMNGIKGAMKSAASSAAGVGVGVGLMAMAWKLSTANRESEKIMSNFRTLGVLDMDHEQIVRDSKEVESSINDMLKMSHMPIDKKSILAGAYDLKSMQINQANDIAETSKTLAITAKAGVGTYQEALDSFRVYWLNYASKMNMPMQSKLENFQDVFAATVMQNNLRLPEITSQLEKAGGAAASMGWSIKEIVPAIGLLSSYGMGERTGTSILGMTRNLKKAGDDLGLNFIDAKGRAKPFLDIIGMINTKFGQIDEFEKPMILKAFGEEAAQGVILLNDNFEKLKKNVNSISPGIAVRMAGEAIDNLDDRIIALNNSWLTLKETVAGTGIDASKMVVTLTNQLDDASRVIAANQNLSGALIKGMFGFGGVVGTGFAIRLIGAGLKGWAPVASYVGQTFASMVGAEFLAKLGVFIGTFGGVAAVAAFDAYFAKDAYNKFKKDFGMNYKPQAPVEIFNPNTGKNYFSKQTDFYGRGGFELQSENTLEQSRKALEHPIKLPKSMDVSGIERRAVAPGALEQSDFLKKEMSLPDFKPVTPASGVETYQDNRKNEIHVHVDPGTLNLAGKENLDKIVKEVIYQIGKDAKIEVMR